jgi:Mg2+ and Co2+ transporter CorA
MRTINGYDLTITWSDGEKYIVSIPDAIAMRIEDYLDQVEQEENEYMDHVSEEVEEMLSFLNIRGDKND